MQFRRWFLSVILWSCGLILLAPNAWADTDYNVQLKVLLVYQKSNDANFESDIAESRRALAKAFKKSLEGSSLTLVSDESLELYKPQIETQLSNLMRERHAPLALVYTLDGKIKRLATPNIMWEGFSELTLNLVGYELDSNRAVRKASHKEFNEMKIGTGTWEDNPAFRERQYMDTADKLKDYWNRANMNHFFEEMYEGTIVDDIAILVESMPANPPQSRKWLFMVAVEEYEKTFDVVFARRSAILFEQAAQKAFGIDPSRTYALVGKSATAVNIKNQLSQMLGSIQEGDIIYFYYSGHGIPDPATKGSFILPQEYPVGAIVKEPDFNLENIYRMLNRSPASKVISFVDACFSGITDNQNLLEGTAPGVFGTVVNFNTTKMLAMTAGTQHQFSNSFDRAGHRMFSYFLIKNLATRSYIDVNEIYQDVRTNVMAHSLEKGQLYFQEPQLFNEGQLQL